MQFYTPTSKKSLKKSNQKWFKCSMKAPIRQVLLHTSLFIVQFRKIYLKNPLKIISSKRTHMWLLWNLYQVSLSLSLSRSNTNLLATFVKPFAYSSLSAESQQKVKKSYQWNFFKVVVLKSSTKGAMDRFFRRKPCT